MVAEQGPETHTLEQLVFPDRYETLVEALGADVAKIVVSPDAGTADIFGTVAEDIRARRQGTFLPIFAATGTGKTTLANNLGVFFGADYAPSIAYTAQEVSFEELVSTVGRAAHELPTNEARILPVIIDDRESAPPSSSELAAIKRFLRERTLGYRSLVLWPETSLEIAEKMSAEFVEMAGSAAVSLPAVIEGPHRKTWQQTAIQTLDLANGASSLELMGVDPRDYNPDRYPSLGEFLRRISRDFSTRRKELLAATQIPLRLCVLFATESVNAGVLSQMTNSNHYGLLDASALLSSGGTGRAAEYWKQRRGLLTRMIMQLDARAFTLPPQVTAPSLRRHGSDATKELLAANGFSNSRSRVIDNWKRSPLGRYLNGTAREIAESRGRPPVDAIAGFKHVAGQGFNSGKDKWHNTSMRYAIEEYLTSASLYGSDFTAESKISVGTLIPDNGFKLNGYQYCLEYTWRSGDFLASNRYEAADYILRKLRDYTQALGYEESA